MSKEIIAKPSSEVMSPQTLSGTSAMANFRKIQSLPALEREKERDLIARWQEYGDKSARDIIIQSHLKMGLPYARKRPKLFDDIMSATSIGLMRALDKFDLDKDFRFSTYASWWVRASIYNDPSMQAIIVKVPMSVDMKTVVSHFREVLGKVANGKDNISAGDLKKVADHFRLPYGEIEKYYLQVYRGDSSLNYEINSGEMGGGTSEVIDLLEDPKGETPEDIVEAQDFIDHRRSLLMKAFEKAGLDDRAVYILKARRLGVGPEQKILTLHELSGEFNITRERVRQIEVRSFKKIQKYMLEEQAQEALSFQAGANLAVPEKPKSKPKPIKYVSSKVFRNPTAGQVARRAEIINYMRAAADRQGLDFTPSNNISAAQLQLLFPDLLHKEASVLEALYSRPDLVKTAIAIAGAFDSIENSIRAYASRGFKAIQDAHNAHLEAEPKSPSLQSGKQAGLDCV